jgi:hypothetical protein
MGEILELNIAYGLTTMRRVTSPTKRGSDHKENDARLETPPPSQPKGDVELTEEPERRLQ